MRNRWKKIESTMKWKEQVYDQQTPKKEEYTLQGQRNKYTE